MIETVKREEDAKLTEGAHPGANEEACRDTTPLATTFERDVAFLRSVEGASDLRGRRDIVVSDEGSMSSCNGMPRLSLARVCLTVFDWLL